MILGSAAATRAAAQPAQDRRPEAHSGPERVEAPGLENLFRLSPKVYSGGQPQGAQGLAALERLGVKTIVTVDGAPPDVAAARRSGMRYVHLPIGYEGISAERATALAKAFAELPGPVYVHCHHGKHRGPAAAAIGCLAVEGWNHRQAEAWLKQAGTSADYAGLYEAVRRFRPPSRAELQAAKVELPERSAVPPLVEVMVEIDQRQEKLATAAGAEWRLPAADGQGPRHEAILLGELFRELARTEETAGRPEEYRRLLSAAEAAAEALHQALPEAAGKLDAAGRRQADAAWKRLRQSCTECHNRFRDRAEVPAGRR